MKTRRTNGCNTLYVGIKFFDSREFFFFLFLWAGGSETQSTIVFPTHPLSCAEKKIES